MSKEQKILRILGILAIIYSVFDVLAGIITISMGATVSAIPALAEISTETLAEPGISTSVLLMSYGIAYIVLGILLIIMGILSIRAAKHPSKSTFLLVYSIIFSVLSIIDVINAVLSGATDTMSLLTLLFPVLLQSFIAFCVIRIRAQVKNGQAHEETEEDRAARKEAKDRRLGPVIIFIIIVFFINIFVTLIVCVFIKAHSTEFTFSAILDLVNMIFEGVCLYLIFRKSKAARWWVIGFSAFNILVGTTWNIYSGNFSVIAQVFSSGFDIFLLLYFCLAKHPRKLFTRDLSIKDQERESVDPWDLWDIKSPYFWVSMVMYFCLFSIVGHWLEAGYCTLIKLGIMPGIYDPTSGIWQDYVSPFPVYGAGMVACGLILYPIKVKLQEKIKGRVGPLVVSFLINSFVCASLELVLGLAQNMPDANGVYPLWDYSNMPFNFMGQICLTNTLEFGLVATIMTWLVFPLLQTLWVKTDHEAQRAIFIGVAVFYAIVICLYMVNVNTQALDTATTTAMLQQAAMASNVAAPPSELLTSVSLI